MMTEKIGEFSPEIVKLLNLDISAGTDIYIGVTNIAHIANEHKYEFDRYFDKIHLILSAPDYVRLKTDDGSIEYIKHLSKYIKVAVRVSGDGKYYVRSLYTVRDRIVKNLLKSDILKRVDKKINL
ncbi:MAG: PBECR2 nuclease fold domain-containing protein [Oscillospiraceae bacterium]|nr:PBECR2 nuclease fold domain-containing protein [Oscillospiraceae bacterium]